MTVYGRCTDKNGTAPGTVHVPSLARALHFKALHCTSRHGTSEPRHDRSRCWPSEITKSNPDVTREARFGIGDLR